MNYLKPFEQIYESIRRWITTEEQYELDEILNIAKDMGFETKQTDLLNRSDSKKPCWMVKISRMSIGTPSAMLSTKAKKGEKELTAAQKKLPWNKGK
jgi:hypothetical protein